MNNKTTTISDWLMDAKQLQPGDTLDLFLGHESGPPPVYADMRAALYAQFGTDTHIRIWKHGQRISIFIHADEKDRKLFDLRNTPIVLKDYRGKRTEIEAGFEKKLPPTGDRK